MFKYGNPYQILGDENTCVEMEALNRFGPHRNALDLIRNITVANENLSLLTGDTDDISPEENEWNLVKI